MDYWLHLITIDLLNDSRLPGPLRVDDRIKLIFSELHLAFEERYIEEHTKYCLVQGVYVLEIFISQYKF